MQLRLDLKIDKSDQMSWDISHEVLDFHKNVDVKIKNKLKELELFDIEYNKIKEKNREKKLTDFETANKINNELNQLRENLFKNIEKKYWDESYFVIEAFKILSKSESLFLIPDCAWVNKVFLKHIENDSSFFNLAWFNGLELFMEDRVFTKFISEPQEKMYQEEFSEMNMSFTKLEVKGVIEYLLSDIDWVIPQVKKNPYIYPYLTKALKINDNVLALTFLSEETKENKPLKPLFVDVIPYQELVKDPYVLAAFFTFFYHKVKNYDMYFSYALKLLKSETQVQAVIDFIEDENVFNIIFNHKDFPQQFKENSSILLQGLKKSKEIYNILPDYMRSSKAVVEIMIYQHGSEFLDSKSVDYWRSDIVEPKLNGPVYEYLKNRVNELNILKFVQWKRSFLFISSLEENPFEYGVNFSEDDFDVITSKDPIKVKSLIMKFPSFYEVSGEENKCNLEYIMEYIKNGVGLFEERFNYVHDNLFFNDDLIFECINNDIGEVLLKIDDEKWNSKTFFLRYMELLDDMSNEGNEAAFECLYSYLPLRAREMLEMNNVKENFVRFIKIDQEKNLKTK